MPNTIVSIDALHPLLLNIGVATHHGDWNWKDVESPFMRLFYVIEGTAQLHMPTATYQLRPGYMYCIPAFTRHSYSCDSLFRLYYMHIYEDMHAHCGFMECYDYPVEIQPEPLDRCLIERLYATNPDMGLDNSNPSMYDNDTNLVKSVHRNRQRTLSNRIESRGILYQLISRLMLNATTKCVTNDERIQRVLNYIRRHLSEPITIDTLAAETCLSNDHLIRLFKREVGQPPLQYITRKKMERAQMLLATDDSAVKSIAYRLGYDDYSYFIRIFKKHTGQSPIEYRRSARDIR